MTPSKHELPSGHGEGPHCENDDRIVAAYLAFLDKSMRNHSELVRPITAADVAGLDEMLEGIEVDLNEDLRGIDYVLP